MDNRLQIRHHGIGSGYTSVDGVFETRQEAIEYIYSQIRFADSGLAFEDKSFGFSLYGEPTVLRYKNEEDETDPHVILAIGSYTNEGSQYNDNRFCIIDIDKTESEIAELWDEIERITSGLTIFTKDSNTLKLYTERTESGTTLSGDVQLASSVYFDDYRRNNIILNTENGLFTFVDMSYDDENEKMTFVVNGTVKEWNINNNYLVRGYYSKRDESLHLINKDESEIVVSLENLIDEWGVEGEASTTPIVLTREEVGYGDNSSHNHVEPWQDVLKADIRLADRKYNILKKTSDGRYLYVDGLAKNITFFKNGEEINVQDALSEVDKGISTDSTNIIYEKADGYYATAKLDYVSRENKLVFTSSNYTGGTSVNEIQLNSVEVFKKVYYDPVTESLIILYVDGNGELQEVVIPIGEMMTDWEWDIQNEGHNVKLHKQRVVAGNDKVSADVALYSADDNILVDRNHELYVKGDATNIKYGTESTVDDELDKLNDFAVTTSAKVNELSGKVDTVTTALENEVSRATSAETRIESRISDEISRSTSKDVEHDRAIETIQQTIGNGFSTDGHETVTYKFNELSANTNSLSAKTDMLASNLALVSANTEAEVVRATAEEQRIEKKFDDELGDGFNIRNTVRDEFDRERGDRIAEDIRLQTEIEEISASTSGKLIDINATDSSIGIDKTDATKPSIKVNLSTEIEDNKPNIIKVNSDGLYAGVDLDYYFESGTSKNVLVFKTTNQTKVFDLKTNSVVDKIYYDATREAIIIEYTVNGHRMPDVVIPVGDLIDEWRPSESTDGAIRLTKTRESGATQDVLYAESIISNHSDNILVNDHGALYVSGSQIEQNKTDINALKGRMTTAENNISNEVTTRQSEISRIENLVHAEEDRATTAENAIANDLNVEEIARANGDTALSQLIEQEATNRENADTQLQTNINSEATTRANEDSRIEAKLDQEISRSTAKDTEHDSKIAEEVQRARDAEHTIREALTQEGADRREGDSNLQSQLNSNVERIDGELDSLDIKIANEKEARMTEDEKIWAKIRPVEYFNTTTIHVDRVRNSGETPDEIRNSVIVANASNNIIKVDNARGGIYSTVSLGYDGPANILSVYDGIGEDKRLLNSVQLGPGSIIKDISYNYAEKTLVVTYQRAGETGDTTMNFPVADLFNEWDVENKSEGSALELHKVSQTTETGTVDKLWGRVLLSGSILPDGTIDYGDNIIRIVNNGLYASGSAITEAMEEAVCTRNELRVIETAVLGNDLSEGYICGSGYTYPKYESACFINAANSMYEADQILDRYLCSAHTRIDEVEQDLDCLDKDLKITQQNVLGITIPECGLNGDGTPFRYKAHVNACIISAATSMDEADLLLNDALCEVSGEFSCFREEAKKVEEVLGVVGNCDTPIPYPRTEGCLLSSARTFAEADRIMESAICDIKSMLVGSESPTISLKIVEEGLNKYLEASARLSHGNEVGKWQTDQELTITDYTGAEIEPNQHEFTDTNVLRVVDLTSQDMRPDSNFNGLYLSNVWDCGQYTLNGSGTPYEKYKTDESATAQNFFDRKFRNGVRYQ